MARPLPPLVPSWVPLAVIIGLLVPYALLFYDFSLPPFEDAAMLMRYAENWASGGGISFNPGEAPVDGATDFLFMAFVTLLIKMGFSAESAVRILTISAHLLTVSLMYRAILKYQVAPRWAAVGSAAFLAAGPALGYIESYFGTPFFALFGLLAFIQAIKIAKDGPDWWTEANFVLYGLIAGLIRPEGVFLAGFILLSLVWFLGLRKTRRLLLIFIGGFGVFGGAYFVWHWSYFGYPLPNPFYVKGGGTIYLSSLKHSILNVFKLGGPILPVFFLGLRNREQRRFTFFLLIPIFGFTLIWILMSNAMNFFMRFQYVTLPMILVAWPWVLKNAKEDFRTEDWSVLKNAGVMSLQLAMGAFLFIALLYQHLQYGGETRFYQDGRYELAIELSEYQQEGYSLVASEAGIIPLYSQWRAIDPWGLNDKHIAHSGTITPEYLDQQNPGIIMFRAHYSPAVPPRVVEPDWSAMVEVLQKYAESHDFTLAAAYGDSPWAAHYYYVNPKMPGSAKVVSLIRNREYFWYESGNKAVNYARLPNYTY